MYVVGPAQTLISNRLEIEIYGWPGGNIAESFLLKISEIRANSAIFAHSAISKMIPTAPFTSRVITLRK